VGDHYTLQPSAQRLSELPVYHDSRSKECHISAQDLEVFTFGQTDRHTEKHKLLDTFLHAYFIRTRIYVRILLISVVKYLLF
jgi:hypothetical protein